MRKYIIIILTAAGVVSLTASDQIPAPPQEKPVILRGGTVHPVSAPSFTGDILFDGGKIVAMGPEEITPPANTKVVDISGRHVYPGLISPGSTLGLVEINAVRATRDPAETGWLNPNVRVERSYNPDSEIIPVTRSNGVLLAHVTPIGGRVSGTSAVMKLDGWTWEDCVLSDQTGIHLNWPQIKTGNERDKKGEKKGKKNKIDELDRLDQMMEDARAYLKGKQEGSLSGTDMRWEALIPVIQKEIPFFIHAHREIQIKSALDWCDKQDVNMILMGGTDSWRVADLLRERNIPVIYANPLSTPIRRDEPVDTRYTVPVKLYEAGVKFCISSPVNNFQTPHLRNLPYEAAMTAAFGLPREEALKAITLYPAEILGIADRVGSLEPGKDATLIITTGNPLEITSRVTEAYIEGRRIDLNDRHKTLYRKYQEKYRQLNREAQEK